MADIKVDVEKCVGCGTCVDVCMGGVLEVQKIGTKKKSVPVNPDSCIFCLNCMNNCDYDAIKVYTPEGHLASSVLAKLRETK